MTAIWFDRAHRSIVAGCRECGCREVFATQAAADSWAFDHAARAHPDAHRVTASLARRHARHTDQ